MSFEEPSGHAEPYTHDVRGVGSDVHRPAKAVVVVAMIVELRSYGRLRHSSRWL